MYSILLKLLVSFVLVAIVYASRETTCREEQQQFAKYCFSPKSLLSFDFNWYLYAQPENGWYFLIGNEITRHHCAKNLRGKNRNLQLDHDHSCLKVKFSPDNKKLDDHLTGYGNLEHTWKCSPSVDFPGSTICNGNSKYHENLNVFQVYVDYTKYVLNIICFPNGQPGWFVLANHPTLSANETLVIAQEVNRRGFVYEDHVILYNNELCSK